MKLSLFDLHCDTAEKMLTDGEGLLTNPFAVSLSLASVYREYVQVMAFWTPPQYSDEEGWLRFIEMYENLRRDPALQSGKAILTDTLATPLSTPLLLLAVEDARILAGDLTRLKTLRKMGFRFLIPLWKGESCIGGAYNTNLGLTPFGRDAVAYAIALGMIPDISHASERSAEEIFSIAADRGAPVIASHSNAYACHPAPRNLRDGQVRAILASGGLIGINLHVPFLCEEQDASTTDVLRHIDHFLSLGAQSSLSLGCDMDGAVMPSTLSNLSELRGLADALARQNYPEDLIRAIFFENAARFARKYIV